MARYTGPACRLCRRVSEKLFLKGDRCSSPKCAVERRGSPPGAQAQRRRRRLSDRGLQLQEKQKARYAYGILERQFRRLFAMAARKPGATGEYLIQLLERRLDNVVYRLGMAASRDQARQIVLHGHITVNGGKVDIPSYLVKGGDIIGWRQGSTKTDLYKKLAEAPPAGPTPGWLSLDVEHLTGRVLSLPSRSDIQVPFSETAIVEYYSR